ncbi:hypothetical protein CEXT_350971 [Caerostris extrusa]|uniref:Uncharacterized protein n=1 Tax=Caerostris extrusa TaxID=172846 RepID=A0AAV4MJQ2_CAEEX|nr:hypothetical protein CEXT_350971 [Caerostris extrusa]
MCNLLDNFRKVSSLSMISKEVFVCKVLFITREKQVTKKNEETPQSQKEVLCLNSHVFQVRYRKMSTAVFEYVKEISCPHS